MVAAARLPVPSEPDDSPPYSDRPLFHHEEAGRAVYGLTRKQYADVRTACWRYFSWEASGRQADPWASGVARSSWSAGDRVKGSSPGSRPPVAAIEPEPDSELVAIAQTLAAVPGWHRQVVKWKSYGDEGKPLSNEQIAERLGRGADSVKGAWAELAARLHYRMHRLVTNFDQRPA
jgi:hypothetical protein